MSDAQNAELEQLDLLSVKEAAILLGKCKQTIYRWIESGNLKALRFGGGDYMIPRDELMKSLEYKPTQAQQ